MKRLPRLLFKFRGVSTEIGKTRALEIIDNYELFFPMRKKLNDPFEGIGGRFSVNGGGYAGISMHIAVDEEIPFIAEKRNEYRILSLSEDCFSPLLWALYGDEGNGVCLSFRTDGIFKLAKSVEYSDPDPNDVQEIEKEKLEKKIEEDLYTKSRDWQHEKEWRIIEKSDSSHFRFQREDLVAVIFGYKIDPGTKERIIEDLPRGTKLFKTHLGGQSKAIKILPEDYTILYGGNEPDYIKTLDELNNAIFNS